MWVAVELTSDHSGWSELARSDDLSVLKNHEFEKLSSGEISYFWGGEYPGEPAALQSLYDKMVEANGGIELKLLVGASIGQIGGLATTNGCSGSLCFCVVQGSYRGCEVCWQGPSGAVCRSCDGSC